MKRLPIMLVSAVLASNLAASEALGQNYDNVGRFESDSQVIGDGRSVRKDEGLRYGPRDDFGASQPEYDVQDGRKPRCYFPDEWPERPPWPPFCD